MTFRKKLYEDIETLQSDLDAWLAYYNHERTIKVRCVAEGRLWRHWRMGKPFGRKRLSVKLDLTDSLYKTETVRSSLSDYTAHTSQDVLTIVRTT